MAKYAVDGVPYEIDDSVDMEQTVAEIRQSGYHMEKTNSLGKNILKQAAGGGSALLELGASTMGMIPALGAAGREAFERGDLSKFKETFVEVSDMLNPMSPRSPLGQRIIPPRVASGLEELRQTDTNKNIMTAVEHVMEAPGDIAGGLTVLGGGSDEAIQRAKRWGDVGTLTAATAGVARAPFKTLERGRNAADYKALSEMKARQEAEQLRIASEQFKAIREQEARMAGPYQQPMVEKALTLQDRDAGLTGPTQFEGTRMGLELETPEAQTARLNPEVAKTPEGMNFPLRQEVLNDPAVKEITDSYRSEHARMKEEGYPVEDIARLEQAFGEYMQRYGVKTAQDAHGLNRPLYEGEARALPIERSLGLSDRPTKPLDHTQHTPSAFELSDFPTPSGKMKLQRGFVDPRMFLDGFKFLRDGFLKTGDKIKLLGATNRIFDNLDHFPPQVKTFIEENTVHSAKHRMSIGRTESNPKVLRVIALDNDGLPLGMVEMRPSRGKDRQGNVIEKFLESDWTFVENANKGKHVALSMYDAILAEGSDIRASSSRTAEGKGLWLSDSFKERITREVDHRPVMDRTNKGPLMQSAGFRNKTTGRIVATGPFHDKSKVPYGYDPMKLKQWEAGFVDRAGQFYTRTEANELLNKNVPGGMLHSSDIGGIRGVNTSLAPNEVTNRMSDPFKGPGKKQAGAVDFSGFMQEAADPRRPDLSTIREQVQKLRQLQVTNLQEIRKWERFNADQISAKEQQHLTNLHAERTNIKQRLLELETLSSEIRAQFQPSELRKFSGEIPKDPTKGPGKRQAGGIQIGETRADFKKRIEKEFPGQFAEDLVDALYDQKQKGKPFESFVGETNHNALSGIPGVRDALKDVIPDLRTFDEVKQELLESPKPDWADGSLKKFLKKLHIEPAGSLRLRPQWGSGPTMTARISASHPMAKFYGDHWSAMDDRIYMKGNDLLHSPERGIEVGYSALSHAERDTLHQLIQRFEGKQWLSPDDLVAYGMNEKQIDAYRRHREVMGQLRTWMNERLPENKQIPDRPGYFPAKFMGEFFAKVWAIDGEKRTLIGIPHANNRYTLNRHIDAIKEMHPEYEIEPVMERNPLSSSRDRAMVFNTFGAILDALESTDPRAKALSELLDQYRTEQSTVVSGIKPHFEQKKGIFGSTGKDPFKSGELNAKEAFEAEAMYIQQAIRFIETTKLQDEVVSKLLDKKEFSKVPNIQSYIEQHWDRYRNVPTLAAKLQNAAITGVAHGLGFSGRTLVNAGTEARTQLMMMILGYNQPRFLATQLAQAPQMLPQNLMWLSQKLKEQSPMKMTEAVVKGLADMAKGEHLTGDTAKAVKWAEERGVLTPRMFEDIKTDFEKQSHNIKTFLNGETSIRWTEKISRREAYLTFYHYLKEAGLKGEELYGTASEVTRQTMGDYRLGARPLMYQNMGAVGSLMSPLTTFKHNQYSQIALFLKELHESGYKDTNAMGTVATTLAVSTLYAGLSGLLLKEDADLVINVLKQIGVLDADFDDITTRMIKGQYPDLFAYGLWSAMFNVDMSASFSNAAVIPDSRSKLTPLLEKGLGMAGAGIDMVKQRTKNSVQNFIHEMLPSGPYQGTYEGMISEDGMVPDLKHRGEGKYERTPDQQMKRNFGFRDLKESRDTTIMYKERQREALQQKQKTRLVERAGDAYRSGEPLDKYFEDAAKLGMAPRDLLESIKALEISKRTTDEQQFQGLKPRSYNQMERARRLQEYR